MASKTKIVSDLMREIGKTKPSLRMRLEQTVGELTIDLLTQNGGTFKGLEERFTFTVSADQTQILLPADYNTPVRKGFYQVNSSGEFLAEANILSKSAVRRNIAEHAYSGHRLAYVDELDGDDGYGFYLVLAGAPAETVYFELDYYRAPTESDTGLIRNESILKDGVRGSHSGYWADAGYRMEIYRRRREGFRESPDRQNTRSRMVPSERTGQHNRRMRGIGRGRG